MRRRMLPFATLIPAVAWTRSARAEEPQESQLDVVLKRDKLIIGTYSTSPPLAYVDDNGNLVGMEIDLARQLAKDLLGDEKKLEFVVLQSDGRFPAVLSGKIDCGLCSTTITPDRAVRIAFTYPYVDSAGTVLARKDAHITKLSELNDSRFTYAILNVPPAIARAKEVLPKATQLLLDSPSALFLAVKAGRATAFGIDKPIADFYAGENADLMLLDTSGTPFANVSNDSIFLKPGDFKWWLFLDTYVRELRFGTRYDLYTEWYRKWLKRDPPPQRYYDVTLH
jgi:polar amino acid transport system substrate-binding protein